MKLLLVEDEPAMRATLQRAWSRQGMDVALCGDGAQALAQWRQFRPDVVVLDLTLPGLDGLDVLQQARAAGLDAPVLILTARGTVGDRIIGLNTGADDYLAKPFDLDELEARIRALARRRGSSRQQAQHHDLLAHRLGPLRYDRNSGAIYLRGEVLELAPRELALLAQLMQRPGQAVSKEHLFEAVFADQADVHFEAIEVVVYRARKRLAGSGVDLVTLRGLGYLLKEQR
jgi:two-component system response regulator TctD